MAVALALPQAIPALGWFRIVIRLFLMIALLAACIPLFYVFRLTGRRNPVPRFFLGGVAWITGVEIKVTGTRPRRGAFLLANHVSWIDVPALASATGAAFVGHDGWPRCRCSNGCAG